MVDILKHNRDAWNIQSQRGERPWVRPVDGRAIESARRGDWTVILTPLKPVPQSWFGDITGQRVLCLASGGGQQAPIFAAAGANVTSFDNSDVQLDKDRFVAERDGLDLTLEQGDMADLGHFDDGSFDLIFHPVSNVFAPDVRSVWRECHRVLAEHGRLLSGFMNPDFYLFDHESIERGGPLEVRFELPYSDLDSLPEEEIMRRQRRGEAIEFSHSLGAQIGGQLEAGFTLAGFYEDRWDDESTPLNRYMPTSFATFAIKEVRR
jgi:SAM-dependent methyltransferase